MSAVSVVIPAYNHARYLPEAIESALAQTLPPHEVIVVDDGSRDDTPAVLEQYRARITIISQQNAGVSAARNHGVERSTGDFLAFLDADDVWLPSKLERQVECLREHPEAGLVHCGVQEIDTAGQPLRLCQLGMESAPDGGEAVADEMLMFRRPTILGGGSGVMIPRRVFGEAGGFDLRLSTSADWDLYYRIARRHPVAFVPEPLLRYRLHGANMHGNIQAMEQDMLLAFRKAFAAETRPVLRRRAYGSLHRVLAGSYFAAGHKRAFLRHSLLAICLTPGAAGYFLSYPLRQLRRQR